MASGLSCEVNGNKMDYSTPDNLPPPPAYNTLFEHEGSPEKIDLCSIEYPKGSFLERKISSSSSSSSSSSEARSRSGEAGPVAQSTHQEMTVRVACDYDDCCFGLGFKRSVVAFVLISASITGIIITIKHMASCHINIAYALLVIAFGISNVPYWAIFLIPGLFKRIKDELYCYFSCLLLLAIYIATMIFNFIEYSDRIRKGKTYKTPDCENEYKFLFWFVNVMGFCVGVTFMYLCIKYPRGS